MKYLIIIISAMMLASCHSRSRQHAKNLDIQALKLELEIEKEKNLQYKDSLMTVKYNNVDHCVYYGKKTPHIHDCERK